MCYLMILDIYDSFDHDNNNDFFLKLHNLNIHLSSSDVPGAVLGTSCIILTLVWAIPKDSAKCASLLCIKLNPTQDAACGRRIDKLDKQMKDTKAAPQGGLKWPCVQGLRQSGLQTSSDKPRLQGSRPRIYLKEVGSKTRLSRDMTKKMIT